MLTAQPALSKIGLRKIGSIGHLAIFIWLMLIAMLVPQRNVLLAATLCIIVVGSMYPRVFKQVANIRFAMLGLILMLPPFFLVGAVDRTFLGMPYSSEGFLTGLQIGVRFWMVLLSVFGFTGSVDITTLANLLERLGLRGLGFSFGVALNLVPSLRNAAIKTWHSMKMRGGFRKKWLRGIRLYFVIVITNALRQAEDIAIAAESRAYSPEKSHVMQIHLGFFDYIIIAVSLLSFILILLWT